MTRNVIDLEAVRSARRRLADLARKHPETLQPGSTERAAAWLAIMENRTDDKDKDEGDDDDEEPARATEDSGGLPDPVAPPAGVDD